MQKYRRSFFIVMLSVFSISLLPAQTFEDALRPFWTIRGFGASSFAVTNGSTFSRDVSSLSLNPANLATLQRPAAYMAFQYGLFDQEGQLVPNARTSEKSENYFRHNGFGFAYPVEVYQGSFVLGFAFAPSAQYNNVVRSEGLADFESSQYYLKSAIDEIGTLNSFKLSSAVEFRENLFLGLSVNFHRGDRRYTYEGIDSDTTDAFTYSRFIRTEVIKPEYRGANIDFGLSYHTSYLAFGLRLSTPLKLSVDEVNQIREHQTYEGADPSSAEDLISYEYSVRYPMEFATNAALTLHDITLAFDFTFHNWGGLKFDSNIEETIFNEDDNSIKKTTIDNRINTDIKLNLHRTTDIGVGLTLPLYKNITAKLGYRLIPRPYDNLPKNEQYNQLMGLGVEAKLQDMIILGLNYQLATGSRKIRDSYFSTTTSQKFREQQFTISTSILL